jgi:hypothetical protein
MRCSCVCGTQFCYQCTAGWKTCDCPRYDDDLIRARAARTVRRQFQLEDGEVDELEEEDVIEKPLRGVDAQKPNSEEFAARIQTEVNRMRTGLRKCKHKKLRRVDIGGVCDACGNGPAYNKWHVYLMRGCFCSIEVCL